MTEYFKRAGISPKLPDIPFDPKFIAYPFDTQRFISYNPTGLERNYKYELLTEHDLGVAIDLINPDAYSVNEFDKPAMHPDDEKLLEEEMNSTVQVKLRSSSRSGFIMDLIINGNNN